MQFDVYILVFKDLYKTEVEGKLTKPVQTICFGISLKKGGGKGFKKKEKHCKKF